MNERQYSHSKAIKLFSASVKAKEEDRREIIGILLSLLVIAAFIFIAFIMAIPMAKADGDMVTSEVGLACLGKALKTRP